MNDVVREQDLELLEEYLDDALTHGEIERLQTRLADEPALADALAELRVERDVRSACFASMEPSESACVQFSSRVSKAARKQASWSKFNQYTRWGGAAAACILVGFFVGWLGREKGGVLPSTEMPTMRTVSTGVNVSEPRRIAETPGVQISEVAVREAGRTAQMLIVSDVEASSSTGLRKGDLILTVDGQKVSDCATLANILSQPTPAEHRIEILRDGRVIPLRGRVGT